MTDMKTVGAVLDSTVDQIRTAFETNTISVFRVSKAVAYHMARRKQGTIVVIGSIAGLLYVPPLYPVNVCYVLSLLAPYLGVVFTPPQKPLFIC